MQRLNPFTAAPGGFAVLSKVEDYIKKSGLEPGLLALVRVLIAVQSSRGLGHPLR
jgi:hypothetical protein